MMQYAFFAYHRKDDNMLETCINSLRLVNQTVGIIIVTDGVPDEFDKRMVREYGVCWIRVPPVRMVKRRATCKIEVLRDFVERCNNGGEILVSDVDVYFIRDPFKPFMEKPDMDLGLTTRGYQHLFPINGGVFYIRVNDKMRVWLDWYVGEIYHPKWHVYIELRKKYKHEHYGLDWSVGQDFLIANWMQRENILQLRGIKIEDVGPRYNYCPPTDTIGKNAFTLAWKALETGDISVLHMKSDLKRMIYEPGFPAAKIKYPKGDLAWC